MFVFFLIMHFVRIRHGFKAGYIFTKTQSVIFLCIPKRDSLEKEVPTAGFLSLLITFFAEISSSFSSRQKKDVISAL